MNSARTATFESTELACALMLWIPKKLRRRARQLLPLLCALKPFTGKELRGLRTRTATLKYNKNFISL